MFELPFETGLRRSPRLGERPLATPSGGQAITRGITQVTRDAVQKWIEQAGLKSGDFLFPSRIHGSPHLGTKQYARILESWVEELGLDPAD